MFFQIILYALFSAVGLTFLKLGAKQDFSVSFYRHSFMVQINYMIVLGLFFYIVSFLLSLFIMKKSELNLFYSVSVGLVYICVCFMSYFVLRESISVMQLVGMCLIFAGVIIMNLCR